MSHFKVKRECNTFWNKAKQAKSAVNSFWMQCRYIDKNVTKYTDNESAAQMCMNPSCVVQ